MDLLRKYGDDDDASDSDSEEVKLPLSKAVPAPKPASSSFSKALTKINSAPGVDLQLHEFETAQGYIDPTTKMVYHNPTADQMWQPVMGPQSAVGAQLELRNTASGYVEKAAFDDATFFEQYHSFNTKGVALNPSLIGSEGPSGDGIIRRLPASKADAASSATTADGTAPAATSEQPSATGENASTKGKRKRVQGGAASDVGGFLGPWAPKEGEVREQKEITEEQKKYAEKIATKKKKEDKEIPEETPESTVFHGDVERDYQGRTYMHFPEHLIKAPEKNYIPKQPIHTYSGHTKGVTAIRFFPGSGHLLLSSSMDSTVKIWGVGQGNRKLLRTYSGHNQTVRDICFNKDGSRFLTASFDKYIKLWDTETGQCISKHTTKKLPYCVKFHPDKFNEFLAGQQNKKIVQWSLDSNEVTCEYDEHLGPVNTVTFIDENRRFVSTSDDKKVFIWEYGIPVVIKHIAEPDMHSMPYVEVHPNQKWWCGQSLDNQILVYSTQRGFKLNKRKRFLGHFNAGYAPQISFSPDGKFITSGDGNGRVFFWDWATSRVFNKLHAHDKVTVGCIWHPIEPSRFATCSWDGLIKLWD